METGLWELPGGKPLDGEPVEDAVVREVYEECGLRVCGPLMIGVQSGWGRSGRSGGWWLTVGFSFYGCGQILKAKEPEKHTEWQWRDPDDLSDTWPLAAEFIAAVVAGEMGSIVSSARHTRPGTLMEVFGRE